MGTEDKETLNAEAAKRLTSKLQFRDFGDDDAGMRIEIYSVTRLLESFPLVQTLDLERRYNELDSRSREYVSDVLVGYASDLLLSHHRTGSQIAAHIIAATIAAPVFSGHKARHGVKTATGLAESLSLNIAYAYKMEAQTINWDNREIITYALGTALVVAAARKDATSFDNVLWLGRNSEKLVPLIDRIAEVSAEREYLESLIEQNCTPLNNGVI